MVLMAMMLGAGYSAFAMTADTRDHAVAIVDPITRSLATRQLLGQTLANARVTGRNGPLFRGTNKGAAGNDEISFLATSAPPWVDGPVLVRMFIDGDGATPERGLVFELTDPGLAWRKRVEVARQVIALDARYLIRNAGVAQWTSTWASPLELPEGIEINLGLATHDTIDALLEAPLLVRLGNS